MPLARWCGAVIAYPFQTHHSSGEQALRALYAQKYRVFDWENIALLAWVPRGHRRFTQWELV